MALVRTRNRHLVPNFWQCNTSVLEIPDCYVKEINKLSFDFIWEGKPAKIKRKTIISDISQGGLRIMDFEVMNKALKIAWIKRITENVQPAWKIIPELTAAKYGGLSFLTKCQYDIKHFNLDNLPPFTTRYLSIGKNTMLTNSRTTNAFTTKSSGIIVAS